MTLSKSKKITFLIVLVAIALISFFFFMPTLSAKRRIFTFPLMGSERAVVEVRYLRTAPDQSDLQLFVDDLLLGPQTNRARPLFSRGTQALFCFVRDRTLYVNLTKDALLEASDAAPILDGIAYFKQNILKNFPQIKEIELFIDGKQEDRPVE